MIDPSPTTTIDPRLARGNLIDIVEATATKPRHIRLSFPNTSYKISLNPEGEITAEPGKQVVGTIHAQATRLDKINAGGRFIDPVFGRPRRVQGRVVAVSGDTNEVIVSAGVPVHLHPTDKRQKATDFHAGEFITCGILDGAVFRPVE
jgi:hypothetical protein